MPESCQRPTVYIDISLYWRRKDQINNTDCLWSTSALHIQNLNNYSQSNKLLIYNGRHEWKHLSYINDMSSTKFQPMAESSFTRRAGELFMKIKSKWKTPSKKKVFLLVLLPNQTVFTCDCFGYIIHVCVFYCKWTGFQNHIYSWQ